MLNEDEKLILDAIQKGCDKEKIADFTKLEKYRVETFINSLKKKGLIRDGKTFDEHSYVLTAEGQFAIKDPNVFFQQKNMNEIEILDIIKELKNKWKKVKNSTDQKHSISYLKSIITFIDQTPLIISYLGKCTKQYNYSEIKIGIPRGLEKDLEEIQSSGDEKQGLAFFYEFLKVGSSENGPYRYQALALNFGLPKPYMKNLNQIIENHFIVPLEDYLKSLMPEQQQYSNTSSIYIYNNTGIGNMNGGEIKAGAKVAGVINETEQKNLAKTAAEIQQLLEQLSQNYPTNTTTEQMVVATKAIEQIESNPDLKQKVINAAKEGGLAAFEKALDNPIGAFSIGAIKGWLEAKAE